MICPNCGNYVADNDGFCGNCGAKIQQPYNGGNYQNQRQSNNNAAVIVLTVAITVLALIAVGLFVAIKMGVFTSHDIEEPESDTTAVTYVTREPVERIDVYGTAPDEYIYATDRYYITEDELSGLSKDEVRLVLNEMYARHGYIFQTDTYARYFGSKTWYVPRISSNAEAEARFNSVEKENLDTIINYEIKMGWR